MALVMVGLLAGFCLGAVLALYAVWVGLRWSQEIRRSLPVSPVVGTAKPDGEAPDTRRLLREWMVGAEEDA